MEIAFLQVAIGAGALYLVVTLRGDSGRLTAQEWRTVAALALFANVLPSLLIAWAEHVVASGVAGITNATTPLFLLGFAAVFHHQRFTTARFAGFGLGFAGVVVVAAPWAHHNGSAVRMGALLLAAASYAVAYAYADRVLPPMRRSPWAIAASQLLAAAVILFPIVIAELLGGSPRIIDHPPSLEALLALLALGTLTIGLGYALNYRLLLTVGAVRTSLVTYLIPVVAVLLGIALLGESLTWNVCVGGLIVIGGVALAESGPAPERAARESAPRLT